MDRRAFLHNGCLACLAGIAAPLWLSSCSSTQAITATLEGEELVVPVASFVAKNGAPKRSVIVTHPQLKQPVVVFHEGAGYRALLMRCTHKGVDLRLSGDRLECDAHGSSFDDTGAVLHGPASKPLRVLPVEERDGLVFISLKA
jgi:nitrite reductase/ring-hydroxylating ferredoxin subunit